MNAFAESLLAALCAVLLAVIWLLQGGSVVRLLLIGLPAALVLTAMLRLVFRGGRGACALRLVLVIAAAIALTEIWQLAIGIGAQLGATPLEVVSTSGPGRLVRLAWRLLPPARGAAWGGILAATAVLAWLLPPPRLSRRDSSAR